MSSLLNDAAARAMRYLDGISQRRVTPDADSIAAITRLDEALSDTGKTDASTLALLDEVGSPASMAIAGPRFFGFVMGGSLPATIASNWLTTVWEQNACMHEITPVASRLEQIALNWLIDVLRLPADTGAGFVTGTTVANFTALNRRSGNHDYCGRRSTSNADQVTWSARFRAKSGGAGTGR
jgi:glutamate/tyrosine decarboxylase-like PLP-dependent enzyme